MSKKLLMIGGIGGPLIYFITVIIGGFIVSNYSHLVNTVSDLQKQNVENGIILSFLFVGSAIFLLLFGFNIIRLFGRKKKTVLLGGVLIIAHAVCAILLSTVFRMSAYDSIMPGPGDPRLIIASLTALITILMIVFVSIGFNKYNNKWNYFLLYSLISIVFIIVLGMSQSVVASNNIKLVGFLERLTHLAYLQWIVVFSIKIYRLELEN